MRAGTGLLWLCLFGYALGAQAAGTASIPADPLDSSRWRYIVAEHFRDARLMFDERVQVRAPDAVEDGRATPVFVRISGLDDVRRIRVLADAVAPGAVLDYFPDSGAAARDLSLGFGLRLAQATPLRAAVLTGDGVWHIGGRWIDAQGGGCAAPSMTLPDSPGSGTGTGLAPGIEARAWPRPAGYQRLKFRIRAPASAREHLPAITQITISDSAGRLRARLVPGKTLDATAVFTLDIASREPLHIDVRDARGQRYERGVGPAARALP